MLKALDTPGWKRIFDDPSAKKLRVVQQDVVSIKAVRVPDHETKRSCEMMCPGGYLALFELKGRRLMTVRARCNGSAEEGLQICTLVRT